MEKFKCTRCGTRVFFINRSCLKCGSSLGFDAGEGVMSALEPKPNGPGLFRRIGSRRTEDVRYCSNYAHGVCNWLTGAGDGNGLCVACDLNRMIPNLAEPGSLAKWGDFERAKKRLVYSLLRFGLPLGSSSAAGRLVFDFARDITTGHLDGVITVDMAEADAVERTRTREQLAEPYRSLLGHLRHESGHYYWSLLVDAGNRHDEFRALFGDERASYQDSMSRHYNSGPPADWPHRFVSAYASMHPWEDWAESWAHYLHMVDAVDTAEAEGMEPRASGLSFGAVWPFRSYDVYREESFEAIVERWIPLTIALNSLNRSMGHDDFYPFVTPAPAYEKMALIHRFIRGA